MGRFNTYGFGHQLIEIERSFVEILKPNVFNCFTIFPPVVGSFKDFLGCYDKFYVCGCVFSHDLEKPHLFDSTLSTQNLGVALMSMASGKILDQKGYFMLEIFFCACVCRKWRCVAQCSNNKKL